MAKNEPGIERNSMGRSVLGLILIVAIIIAAAVGLFLNPWILADLFTLLIYIVVVIVVVAVVFYLAVAVLAVPYYAAKGEMYQTQASYDLDDVESIKETNSDEKNKKN